MRKREPSRSERYQSNIRATLGSSLATLSFFLLSSDSPYPSDLPRDSVTQLPNVGYDQPKAETDNTSIEISDLPDKGQLQTLLDKLGSNERQANYDSVARALRVVDGPMGPCTGLQIDESGIYLTARHCVFQIFRSGDEETWETNVRDIQVKNPYTGEVYHGIGFIAHPEADVALLFAPTGKEPTPMEGVVIDTNQPFDRQQFWLNGFIPPIDYGDTPDLFIENGKVSRDIELVDFNDPTEWDGKTYTNKVSLQAAVMGIQPHGGNSGGTILDDDAEVVGVLSGAVLTGDDHTNERSNYDGARIVIAKSLLDLPTIDPILLPQQS